MVVRMERLAELEHHVVRDVDDVVDGAHTRRDQALLDPGGRRPDAYPGEERRRETRTGDRVLDTHIEVPARPLRQAVDRRLAQPSGEDRRDLARDPDHAETIRAVRLKLERQDRLAENVPQPCSHRKLSIENLNAVVILALAELLRREHHALALNAPHRLPPKRRPLAGVPIDDLRAFVGERHDVADGEIRRTGDDGLRTVLSVFDGRELQLVRIRMLCELGDPPDPDFVVPPRPFDALHFGAGHVQPQGELVDGHADVDVLAQPRDRHLYQHQNCSKYRRSF